MVPLQLITMSGSIIVIVHMTLMLMRKVTGAFLYHFLVMTLIH
ncbi:hypothetical protein KR49_14010 [Synechococcus sp. KORDI-49]|nr:hypothetical protein KR49_14010 [Synechococcus sp. KORDI-49]